FAKDYYKKVADNKLVEKLAKKKNMTFRTFQKMGREFEVCPFELQMDSLHRADVVIADYNYVFSPRNSLARLSNNGYGEKTQPNLVIDEAHNLPSRANDYFSATLDAAEFLELQKGFSHLSEDLYRLAQEQFRESIQLIENQSQGSRRPIQVELDKERFGDFGVRVNEFLARYLESPAQLQPGDAILKFCNLWSNFIGALENVTEDFFCTYTPTPAGGMLKITCCDASAWLNEGYSAFANVVAFSATVKPFDYYSKLLGLRNRALETAEFFSPFPPEHRKLLIIPQVSTKYSDREANYGKIREGIERIIEIKPGNYFVFFPSFEFLKRVAQLLNVPGFEVLQQTRDMKRQDVKSYIEALKVSNHPTLILAVQGGVFAEGVDYPGDMLIGAIIVGPALPSFDFERELLRAYYGKKHGEEHGFDYAYTYPAMAKVVQSAGRVIRSHDDRGLIVLMDRRFVHSNYVKSMPADWVGDDPHSKVSKTLLSDIREFWKLNES
ncbi:MAG: ATP-dependent DNA helicase, partial [Bdellovibrionales bacterium]